MQQSSSSSVFDTISTDGRHVVHVKLESGPLQAFDGRVGAMIEFMVRHRDEIEAVPVGSLHINIGPHTFTPELNKVYGRMQGRPEIVPDRDGRDLAG